MKINEKPPNALAEASGGQLKTNFAGQQKAFSVCDSNTDHEKKTTPCCHECGRDEHAGYRFRLVPVCGGCRTEREVEITRNRFTRREKARCS